MIDITRPGKQGLSLKVPVMLASGAAGFGDSYRHLVKLEKLGALVTNPVTHRAWSPTSETRVVPMSGGVLVHTGMPNPGARRAVETYSRIWERLPIPVLVHLACTELDVVGEAVEALHHASVAGIELGLPDDIDAAQASDFVRRAVSASDLPILVRLPLYDAYEIAQPVADAGADALVLCAPPRGTARHPRTGRLVSGRIYGPLLKPMILRMLGVLRRRVDARVPIIGSGGVHSPADARDFLDAGAVAVQVDSVLWIQPSMAERIARDVSGGLVTRATSALADEWHPDLGDTEYNGILGDDEPAQDHR